MLLQKKALQKKALQKKALDFCLANQSCDGVMRAEFLLLKVGTQGRTRTSIANHHFNFPANV